jgi:hypothetical protein
MVETAVFAKGASPSANELIGPRVFADPAAHPFRLMPRRSGAPPIESRGTRFRLLNENAIDNPPFATFERYHQSRCPYEHQDSLGRNHENDFGE